MAETRLQEVRRILNTATDQGSIGNPSHGGKRRFWNLPRDQFVSAVIYGQQVVIPGSPDDSALIKALRGTAPFDGSNFQRMPQDRPPVSDSDIAFIAQWIADGAPDIDQIGGEVF